MTTEITKVVSKYPLVLSLHGINTRGKWQKELSAAFVGAGFDYIPLDFDNYRIRSLLNPWKRQAQIDWFLKEYTAHSKDRQVSIIAHSFGTYLIARAMQMYPQVKFDRIILCGSIVQPDYSWTNRYEKGQFQALLNDYGHQDWPAWIAAFGVKDAGPSGVTGFTDKCQAIIQRCHPEFGHSYYFYQLNYTEVWIPFLRGERAEDVAADIPTRNIKFYIGIASLVIFLVALGFAGWWMFIRKPTPERDNITVSQFMSKKASSDPGAMERDYIGKEVEWEGYVVSTSPSAEPPFYTLKPQPNSGLREWVGMNFSPKDYRRSVNPGDRIKVRGVIKSIGDSMTQLDDCKIVD